MIAFRDIDGDVVEGAHVVLFLIVMAVVIVVMAFLASLVARFWDYLRARKVIR